MTTPNNFEEIYRIANKYFTEKGNAECVYLFGSFATGKIHSQSDVDFGVLLDGTVPPDKYFDYRLSTMSDLARFFHCEVDVIVLNEVSSFLAFQILRDGRRVYEKQTRANREFEVKSMMQYYDFTPYRRRCEEALIRRIRQA